MHFPLLTHVEARVLGEALRRQGYYLLNRTARRTSRPGGLDDRDLATVRDLSSRLAALVEHSGGEPTAGFE